MAENSNMSVVLATEVISLSLVSKGYRASAVPSTHFQDAILKEIIARSGKKT